MNMAEELRLGAVQEMIEKTSTSDVKGSITDHIVMEGCRTCLGTGKHPIPQVVCYRCKGMGSVTHCDG